MAKTTLFGMKGWRDANERMIGGCSLCSSKRSDSSKRMKSCGHKCQHQAPLKVGILKANKQPQDRLIRHLSQGTQSSYLERCLINLSWGCLIRHLSQGTQSSYLADTRHGMRRSFHQLAKCSWSNVPTLPRHQWRGGTKKGRIFQMSCEPDLDLRH